MRLPGFPGRKFLPETRERMEQIIKCRSDGMTRAETCRELGIKGFTYDRLLQYWRLAGVAIPPVLGHGNMSKKRAALALIERGGPIAWLAEKAGYSRSYMSELRAELAADVIRHQPLTAAIIEQVAALRLAGRTRSEIMRLLHLTGHNYKKALKRARANGHRIPKATTKGDRAWQREATAMLKSGASTAAVAAATGRSASSVIALRRKLGVPPPPRIYQSRRILHPMPAKKPPRPQGHVETVEEFLARGGQIKRVQSPFNFARDKAPKTAPVPYLESSGLPFGKRTATKAESQQNRLRMHQARAADHA